ncbi:MAG: hypothetical protein WCD86_03830 [Ktedonobacteraceae bacterium]
MAQHSQASRTENCGKDAADFSSRVRDIDGLADWLDGTRWPALPGEPQHEWEPPRTAVERDRDRAKRLKALGNAVVPQQIAPILQAMIEIERSKEVKRE